MPRAPRKRSPRTTAEFDRQFGDTLLSVIAKRLEGTDTDLDDEPLVHATVAAMASAADDIVANMVKVSAVVMRRRQSARRGFERRLARTWAHSFDAFGHLCAVYTEYGEEYYATGIVDDSVRDSALFKALLQLHGRSCRVACEIEALLRSGLPDGAFARWRTLHEIAVIALFMAQEGETVARSYLDHDIVKRYKLMLTHEKYAQTLGHQPPTEAERTAVHDAYKTVVASHGAGFAEEYGWAAAALNKPRPKFVDLERHVKLDRFRPYYSWSSSSVHAGSHGLAGFAGGFRLVRPMPAGSTNQGLADPGQNTAISLSQIFAAVSVVRASPFFTLSSIVVGKLAKRCQDAFIAEDRNLKQGVS